jgi:hypothetical protein
MVKLREGAQLTRNFVIQSFIVNTKYQFKMENGKWKNEINFPFYTTMNDYK